METNNPYNSSNQEEMALDDARRTKALSPTMLVMRRFFRNRLAIIGLVILVVMFLFSFVGGLFSPYSQSQVFKGLEYIKKDYATAVYNSDLRVTMKDGGSFPAAARSQMNFAIGQKASSFTANDQVYGLEQAGTDFYTISSHEEVFSALSNPNGFVYRAADVSDDLKAAFEAAAAAGETSFSYEGISYQIEAAGKNVTVYEAQEIALASKMIYDAANAQDSGLVNSFDFRLKSQEAFSENKTSFELDGVTYALEIDGDNAIITKDGETFAYMSDISVEPKVSGVVLSAPFKAAARDAIQDRLSDFDFQDEGEEEPTNYLINRVNTNYYIQRFEASEVIRMKEAPSKEHWLGLDTNGMDVLTRLMYGGRVSLLVGFVVVFFELLIGIIIGGISGYFGGWVDNVLMRFVDLVNSIPFWPVVIIAGSMMDVMEMSSTTRIFFLMFILGILGYRPRRPRTDPFPQGTGLHDRHRIPGDPGAQTHLQAPAAERDAAADRAGHHQPRLHHHFRGDPFLPRSGDQIPRGLLGLHHQRRQRHFHHDQLLVHLDPGRRADPAHRARLQLCRRRSAGRV